jgi:hypothetical protein
MLPKLPRQSVTCASFRVQGAILKIDRSLYLLSALFLIACSGGGTSSVDLTRQGASWVDTQDDRRQREEDAQGRSFSFVVIGCNRVDSADVSKDNPSTANLEQLNRTFREIAELRPRPRFFFLVGDMVYGYSSDASVTEAQLIAWREVYASSSLPKLGIELVAIPGNHESQGADRMAYLAAEEAWLRVMEPYIRRGGNGPHEGEEDGLSTDQSSLTYSFDYRGTHFLVLNTDPVGWDWRVPVRWVQRDLEQASAREARHIFALGHKPAYPWQGAPTDGLSRYPEVRDDFWASMENNGAEAMFSAHNHLWYKHRPSFNGAWQIIVGNGGSVLEASVEGDDAYYGFTQVTVGHHGEVTVTSFGRAVPAEGYLEPSDKYPTSIRDTVSIGR